MSVHRFLIVAVGSLLLLSIVAVLSYHHGYSTCYDELNHLNRQKDSNLVAPVNNTLVLRDLQRECMDLESRLIASQREVYRLTQLNVRETDGEAND